MTLTRDGIGLGGLRGFLGGFRFRTTLSCLPMAVLEINLGKSGIEGKADVLEAQGLFEEKYKDVKRRRICL